MMRLTRQLPVALTYLLLVATVAVAAEAPATKPADQNPADAKQPLKPGDHRRVLKHDGWDRSYVVHVPPKYDPKTPTPIVLAFHGASMNAVMMADFCGLNERADEANFVVVYPNGTGVGELILFFNASAEPAKEPGKRPPDDVGFTRALLDDLSTVINVDSKRVFATGMSNGGMMSYRLAAELSDRIAAIAPVAGTLAVDNVKPKRPVPVMHFHGKNDQIVPFAGPVGRRPKTMMFKGVEASIETFVKVNGCDGKPTVQRIADDTGGDMPATVKTYGGGRQGAEVVLVEIENAGHTWPGQEARVAFIGKSTKAISANDLMWAFFERHPME